MRRATRVTFSPQKRERIFYPRSPCGERPGDVEFFFALNGNFLSTLSLRRATRRSNRRAGKAMFSIHALLAESDRCKFCRFAAWQIFYPRSPCGERRSAYSPSHPRWAFSIHALLAESDPSTPGEPTIKGFSIHALLAESDIALLILPIRRPVFYPRSPCGERPIKGKPAEPVVSVFYPRSPCGERPPLL